MPEKFLGDTDSIHLPLCTYWSRSYRLISSVPPREPIPSLSSAASRVHTFLATGSMHLLIGDSLNLSRNTAGRYILDVADRICGLASQHIKFPAGRATDDVKTAFQELQVTKI